MRNIQIPQTEITMEMVQKVSRTKLARHTREVLKDVQRGRTALIENYGETEAALLDIVDYRILRGVMRAYAEKPEIPPQAGLPEKAIYTLDDPEARYARIFAHYLAGSISLARAAELLGMPVLELRTRCLRLDVPLRTAPKDESEAIADADTAEAW
jgi:predicted HTH domain antitoxin